MRISDWSSDVCSSDLVAPVKRFDVQRHARRVRERVEPVLEQFGVEVAKPFLAELRLPHAERTARDIERYPAQRLVHRRIGVAVAGDALAVAHRLCNRLPDRDAGVLAGVVLLDDRKSVVSGKSVSVRVETWGRGII